MASPDIDRRRGACRARPRVPQPHADRAPSRRACRAPPTSTRRSSTCERERRLVGRVGRRRAARSSSPSRATSWRSTSPASGSSSCATARRRRSLRPTTTLCRHRGSAGSTTAPTSARRRRETCATARRARPGTFKGDHPLPLPLVVLRARRRVSATRRSSARRTTSSRRTSASTRSRSTRGAAGCSSTSSPERVAAGHTLAAQLGEIPDADRALSAGRPPDRAPDRVRRPGQLEGHRRELQRVLPLLGRAPGAVPDRAGVPREGRRATSTGTPACPQAEGTFTFTLTGTTDRAPFPGLDADEQVRHKGELVYPNLMISLSADHVAVVHAACPRRPTGR